MRLVKKSLLTVQCMDQWMSRNVWLEIQATMLAGRFYYLSRTSAHPRIRSLWRLDKVSFVPEIRKHEVRAWC